MTDTAVRWTTVEVFPTRGMAEVAGSALRGSGIPHHIASDDANGNGLPLGLRYNGAHLQVPADQMEAARTIVQGQFAVNDDGDGPELLGGSVLGTVGMIVFFVIVYAIIAAEYL